jgi:hypothetical protein
MWEYIEQLAALIFSSSAIITGVALLLISSCWKTLKEVMQTLPPDERRIIFRLGHIHDKRKKYKEELKGSLWLAILFLGLTVISNLMAMGCVTRTMLGMHGGIYELQDFVVGRWAVIAGMGFLTMSIFVLGYYRFSEFWALRKGKLEIIKELSYDKVPTENNDNTELESKKEGKDRTRSYSLETVRQRYPRAYEKWTEDVDARLRIEYGKGLSIQLLSEMFQRQPSAIRSRLRKLGILK